MDTSSKQIYLKLLEAEIQKIKNEFTTPKKIKKKDGEKKCPDAPKRKHEDDVVDLTIEVPTVKRLELSQE